MSWHVDKELHLAAWIWSSSSSLDVDVEKGEDAFQRGPARRRADEHLNPQERPSNWEAGTTGRNCTLTDNVRSVASCL